MHRPTPIWRRPPLLVGGLMLISPDGMTDIIGVVIIAVIVVLQYGLHPKKKGAGGGGRTRIRPNKPRRRVQPTACGVFLFLLLRLGRHLRHLRGARPENLWERRETPTVAVTIPAAKSATPSDK